jgi:hypothetical protein
MGYKSPHVYTLQLSCAAVNPNDSTDYHFTDMPVAPTAYSLRYGLIPKSGVIRRVAIAFKMSAGSGEAVSIYVRVNDTTDYAITTTATFDADRIDVKNNSLNIPVSEGDTWAIKISTPVWVANPTTLYCTGVVLIECE